MDHGSTLETSREILCRFFRREGRLPSYGEMTTLFGYSSKNAAFRLVKKLTEAGIVSKGSGGKLIPKQLSTPLPMLGSIQAGFPNPEEEELLDTLSLDNYLVEKPEASFLLEVRGDSMIDEGIRPGDVVIIERGQNPRNGDIVVANIDGEWTLKFFEKHGHEVRLIAANSKYPPLVPENELTVGGVVRGVVRKY